jgi:hypothetical protein
VFQLYVTKQGNPVTSFEVRKAVTFEDFTLFMNPERTEDRCAPPSRANAISTTHIHMSICVPSISTTHIHMSICVPSIAIDLAFMTSKKGLYVLQLRAQGGRMNTSTNTRRGTMMRSRAAENYQSSSYPEPRHTGGSMEAGHSIQ